MSNQVFANNTSRYFPAVEQRDIFTLTKNVIGPPPYGTLDIAVSQSGSGLFLNRLNGQDLVPAAGVYPYSVAQNPSTKPYWTLSSSASVLGGALLLTSDVANSIGVNVVLSANAFSTSTNIGTINQNIKITAMLMNGIGDFANAKCVELSDRTFPIAYPSPIPNNPAAMYFTAVVDMLPGQVLGFFTFVRAVDFTYSLVLKDDDNSTGTKLVIENSVSFYKL